MGTSPLGRTLVIANPTANRGQGAEGAAFVQRFLDAYRDATTSHELILTKSARDAQNLAREAKGFDTVLALGGDGVIHEVANGLMERDADDRPQLGIIPMGSGNDYARTLGMEINDPSRAVAQIVRGHVTPLEVGRVNGVYFTETLSFGMDAAIALDTMRRRAEETTSQHGEGLFITSGIRIFSEGSNGWTCRARFDENPEVTLPTIIFAVQVGPTYGGGFAVCPAADPTDGLLDVCYNVKIPSRPWLLALLGLARFGSHTNSSCVNLLRFSHATMDFETQPPCQVDGEELCGMHFEVDVVPKALRVIVP
ncbi:diacylglycerol kinase family protein [Olsenella sp. Marseille-P4559]|uniref:diacylglycerol/lipid kinase family protein n=1 Tax=Olsenella sp. Marseille-P4559 TaxID=2364795 RepID=UPI001030226F|nr:diacylglycerol kinase family protein [Olsenella sp. Marseille-P4559]